MELKTEIKFSNLEDLTRDILSLESDNIVLITEPNIWSRYNAFFKGLKTGEKSINTYKVPSGEKAKTLEEYERCIQFLLSKKIHRNAHLIAIGGGAVSDMAGFIAATYLRGIRWSVVPTTLLSMVDACLGGKVAININGTKNMVGAFHHPLTIYINEGFLESLPSEELTSAMGEIAKYALLDNEIYLKLDLGQPVKNIIPLCLEYKKKIVELDPEEKGQRRLLNLGHTFGHAIEKQYGLAHGTSVFWGMIIKAIVFENVECLEKLKNLENKLHITGGEPPWLNRTFPIDDLLFVVHGDKKVNTNQTISMPVPTGETIELREIAISELDEKLRAKIEFIRTFKI